MSETMTMAQQTSEMVTVRDEAQTWPDRARQVTITNEASYTLATEVLKGIKALRARIMATFGPHIERAYQAHKALLAEKAKADAPLTEAETILKTRLVAWTEQQDRLRQEEEARLREAARVAEAERKLREAAAAEQDGDLDDAAALLDDALDVRAPVVVLPSFTPKVEGVSYREAWKWRVTDAAKVPREYLQLDEQRIGAVVRAMKRETSIPGIEVYPERVAVASGRSKP